MFADFSDKTLQIYDAIRSALEDLDVGILINNVGVIPAHPMYYNELDEQMLFNTIHVNATSVALMTR